MHSTTVEPLLAFFDGLADAGQVRRLGAAFARFVGSLAQDQVQASDAPRWRSPAWCCRNWKGAATAA